MVDRAGHFHGNALCGHAVVAVCVKARTGSKQFHETDWSELGFRSEGTLTSNTMSTTRISHSLPPNIDPTNAPLAFGTRALPKINRELKDEALITRQRALMSLSDLVHNPEKVHESIEVGCMESLKTLLLDSDNTVRQKATEVLSIMVTHNVGRSSFLENNVIEALAKLFDDEVEVVRKNCHQCLEMLSEIPSGALGIVEAKLIPKLVQKLKIELEEMKGLILDTLHFCMHVDATSALQAGVMPVLKDLLSHQSPRIRGAAARDMMDVTTPLAGKTAACKDKEIIPSLVNLLKDANTDVKARAAGAVMTVSITTEGKYKALEAGAIPALRELLFDENSETRLNAIKALTTLAEAPQARAKLLGFVSEIAKLEVDSCKAVARAAEIAKKVITWMP